MALSKDGRRVVTVSLASTSRLWDASSPESYLKVFPGSVTAVAISPDNSFTVSGGLDGHIRIYNFPNSSEEPRVVIKRHPDRILSLAISSDNKYVISGCADGTIRVFRADNGKMLNVLSSGLEQTFFEELNIEGASISDMNRTKIS